MTITSQQVDAWDAEVDAAYEAGRQEGMKQERALWELSKLGQEIEAQPEQGDRRLQIAMRQWEDWKTYALELQKKLVKYEGGSPMILNTQTGRPWVGLTEVDILAESKHWKNPEDFMDGVYWAAGTLKEKNT